MTSNKDQMIELEQQLVLAKQKYKEISEEVEDMRSQVADQTMQTDDYRKKVLNIFKEYTLHSICAKCSITCINVI